MFYLIVYSVIGFFTEHKDQLISNQEKNFISNMINQVRQTLNQFDLFSLPLYTPVENNTKYQTWFGGIITLLIHITIIILVSVTIYNRQAGALTPKVTEQLLPSYEPVEIEITKNMFQADVMIRNMDVVKNFTGETGRLLAYDIYASNTSYYDLNMTCNAVDSDWKTPYGSICSEFKEKGLNCQTLIDVKLVAKTDPKNSSNDERVIFYIRSCSFEFYGEPNCVDKTDQIMKNFYYPFKNQVRFTLSFESMDYSTGKINRINREYQFYLNMQIHVYVSLQKTIAYIDKGFFYQSIEKVEMVTGADIQFVTDPTVKQAYQEDNLADVYPFNAYFRANPYIREVYVSYLKFDELLASASSLLSLMLTIGIVFRFFYQKSYEKYVRDTLMFMYFPMLNQLKLTRNFNSLITDVSLGTTAFGKNVKTVLIEELNKLDSEIQNKFSVFNILYELNQIHMLLKLIVPPTTMGQIRRIGYHFDISQAFEKKEDESQKIELEQGLEKLVGTTQQNIRLLNQRDLLNTSFQTNFRRGNFNKYLLGTCRLNETENNQFSNSVRDAVLEAIHYPPDIFQMVHDMDSRYNDLDTGNHRKVFVEPSSPQSRVRILSE